MPGLGFVAGEDAEAALALVANEPGVQVGVRELGDGKVFRDAAVINAHLDAGPDSQLGNDRDHNELASAPAGGGMVGAKRRDEPTDSVRSNPSTKGLTVWALAGDITVAGQVGEELFQLLVAGKALWHSAPHCHVAAELEDVTSLGGYGFVLPPDHLAIRGKGHELCP